MKNRKQSDINDINSINNNNQQDNQIIIIILFFNESILILFIKRGTINQQIQKGILNINPEMNFNQSQQNNVQNNDIKSEFKNFIHLLQCENIKNFYKSEKSDRKLSIIFSASQPQSSEADKQNSNQSSNRFSPNSSQFQTIQKIELQAVIKQFSKSGLTKKQQKLIQWLCFHIEELTKINEKLSQKNLLLEEQLKREKTGTDQLLEALMKMDQEAKQFWNTYYQLSDNFNQKVKQIYTVSKKNLSLLEQLEMCKKDIKFMKKLVYIANEKFQQLQYQINQKNQHQASNQQNTFSRKLLKPMKILGEEDNNINPKILTARDCSQGQANSKDSKIRKNRQMYSPIYGKDQRSKQNLHARQNNESSSYSPVSKCSRSQKSKKSPSINRKDNKENLNNIEANFKDVYRKMILKTLKNKKLGQK